MISTHRCAQVMRIDVAVLISLALLVATSAAWTACRVEAQCPVCTMITPNPCPSTTPGEIQLNGRNLTAVDSAWFNDSSCASYGILRLNDNSITMVSAGVFDQMTGLVELYLHGNNLTSLPSGLLDNLSLLGQLGLAENRIEPSNLPGLFSNLSNIRTIYLYDNGLTWLPATAFGNLPSLAQLFLSNNLLTTLPSGLFGGLPNLSILHLQNNALTYIYDHFFDSLSSLTTLLLHNNAITGLDATSFNSTASLQELYLYQNGLTVLPMGLFDMALLDVLYLSQNQLASLPQGIFDSLPALRILSLNHNVLTSLPLNAFDSLTSLDRLSLQYNSLTSLESNVFNALSSLSDINLFRNLLTSLPAGVFEPLVNLGSLNLGDNSLSALSSTVFNATISLTSLVLSGNIQLRSFPVGIFDALTSLSYLDISLCGLTSLSPGMFDPLTNLTGLSLAANVLTALPGAIFDTLVSSNKLTYLNLEYNLWTCSSHVSAVLVPSFAWLLSCNVSYTIQRDYCIPSTCLNGATCSSTNDSFVCSCTAGFSGVDCGVDVNDCSASPCLNGASCTDGVNSFVCTCPAVYTGNTCTIDVNECLSSPCLNGGTCSNSVGSFSCACDESVATGLFCETEVTPLPWVDPTIGAVLACALVLSGLLGMRSIRMSNRVLDHVASGSAVLTPFRTGIGHGDCVTTSRKIVAWVGVWFLFVQMNAFSFIDNFEWNSEWSPKVPFRTLGLEIDSEPVLQFWIMLGVYGVGVILAALLRACRKVDTVDAIVDLMGTVLYIPGLRVGFSLLSCRYQQPDIYLLKDVEMICWQGDHRYLAFGAVLYLGALLLFGYVYVMRIRPYRLRWVRSNTTFDLILLLAKIWLSGSTSLLRFYPWFVIISVMLAVGGLGLYIFYNQPFLGVQADVANRVHVALFAVATTSAIFAGVSLHVSNRDDITPTMMYFLAIPVVLLLADRATRSRRFAAAAFRKKREVDDLGVLLYAMKSDDQAFQKTNDLVDQYCTATGTSRAEVDAARETADRFVGRVDMDLKMAHQAEKVIESTARPLGNVFVGIISVRHRRRDIEMNAFFDDDPILQKWSVEVRWLPQSLKMLKSGDILVKGSVVVLMVDGRREDGEVAENIIDVENGSRDSEDDSVLWEKSVEVLEHPVMRGVPVVLFCLGDRGGRITSWKERVKDYMRAKGVGAGSRAIVVGGDGASNDPLPTLIQNAVSRTVLGSMGFGSLVE